MTDKLRRVWALALSAAMSASMLAFFVEPAMRRW